jgi:hypothetical protein
MLDITDKQKERFIRKCNQHPFLNPGNSCIEWIGTKNNKNYGVVSINYKLHLAHRLSWAIYNNQEIPEGLVIRHDCDNPMCINPNHLRLGTRADNVRDRVVRNRNKNGHTLDDDTIRQIRLLYHDLDYTQKQLADVFNTTQTHISRIVNYEQRADVPNYNYQKFRFRS